MPRRRASRRRCSASVPSARFVQACQLATGGNPLLLVELVRTLRAEQVVPDDAHVAMVDNVGPAAAARIVLVRLRRLPAEALAVAQAIAVLGAAAEPSLIAELAEVEVTVVAPAVESLIHAEILEAQSPLGFVHPIVREAIYRELTPAERDRRHARAAELLRARAAAPDQVGSHLHAAPRRAARRGWWTRCASAAADASQRGAVESAITFLRRALAERPADGDFDLRLPPRHDRGGDRSARRGRAPARSATDRSGAGGEDADRGDDHADACTSSTRRERSPRRGGPGRSCRLTPPIDAPRSSRSSITPLGSAARAVEPLPEEFPHGPGGEMLRAVHAWERSLGGGTARECAKLAADVLGVADPAPRRRVRRTRSSRRWSPRACSSSPTTCGPSGSGSTWSVNAVKAGRAHAVIAAGIWRGSVRARLGRLAEAEAAIRSGDRGPARLGPGNRVHPRPYAGHAGRDPHRAG